MTTISGDTGVDKVQDEAITPTAYVCRIKQLVAQNSTSGTSIDFTGIPSWAKKVTVMFNGVSTNGTSNMLIQLGSGSIDVSGYVSSSNGIDAGSAVTAYTTGYGIRANTASNSSSGNILLTILSNNIWTCSYSLGNTTPMLFAGGGSKTLSATLDRLRITTVNGTDLFDAGMINVMVEG